MVISNSEMATMIKKVCLDDVFKALKMISGDLEPYLVDPIKPSTPGIAFYCYPNGDMQDVRTVTVNVFVESDR